MLFVLLLAAGTALPGVSAQVPAKLEMALTETAEQPVCPGALEPSSWPDASNPWFFATSPTARQDDQELAAGVLAPLIDLRLVRGALRLFVLGSPLRSGLQFTSTGWHARWPFC